MIESTAARSSCLTLAGVPLVAAFDGGRRTADGGLPWLAEADTAVAVCATLTRCIPDWRRGKVSHTLETLLRQRIVQLACGDEDQDDADTLGSDPLLKRVCGRLPDSGVPLARQPTMARRENHSSRHTVERLAGALVDRSIHTRSQHGPPRPILRDFDGTNDPAYGEQEGVAFHPDSDQYLYHPLLVFDGDTGHRITAVLRPGNAHGSRLAVLVLRRLVGRLRQVWPGVAIELRADRGFAVPRLSAWCATNAVLSTIGLIPNPTLERLAAPLAAAVTARSAAADGAKVRLVAETSYQAGRWPAPRRVVYTAAALEQGPHPRFVVTTHPEAPLIVYDT